VVTEAEPEKTGYTGLIAPGVAAVMLMMSVDHLYSNAPAIWRGGAPISPFTMFAGGTFFFVLPLWLSRKGKALFPIRMKPRTASLVQRWVIDLSLITMLIALLLGAHAQQQILTA
jgi:hypothetical protein